MQSFCGDRSLKCFTLVDKQEDSLYVILRPEIDTENVKRDTKRAVRATRASAAGPPRRATSSATVGLREPCSAGWCARARAPSGLQQPPGGSRRPRVRWQCCQPTIWLQYQQFWRDTPAISRA